jgi:hypothetical protein
MRENRPYGSEGVVPCKVRTTQPPEMAVAVKPSGQPRTESCVASGNGRCEA